MPSPFAAPGPPGAGRLDHGVEGKQVGLPCDFIDQLYNRIDLAGGIGARGLVKCGSERLPLQATEYAALWAPAPPVPVPEPVLPYNMTTVSSALSILPIDENPVFLTVCAILAIGLLYFNLASVMWTSCFAFTLYRDLVPSYRRQALRTYETIYHSICWPVSAPTRRHASS